MSRLGPMTECSPTIADLERIGVPAALHEGVIRWFSGFTATHAENPFQMCESEAAAATLVRLVASSEFAAGVMLRQADWFLAALRGGTLSLAPDAADLSVCAAEITNAAADPAIVKAQLRQLRNREMVRILWRSIGDLDDVEGSLKSLSCLADTTIIASTRFATSSLQVRFGKPRNADGEEILLIILAMGKLGGRELNFSSDVDLVFLYTDEGKTDGPRSLSAHEYFVRLTRLIVRLLDEVTEDGFVFRVDTRLRPFGDSGPPAVSIAALENYLLQHGRSWERYAYVKARAVCESMAKDAVHDLQTNVIEPFVYRRYLDFGVFESLREMKALVSAEVKRRELQTNIKLGPGGIREIEFIAQSLQLVRGGADAEFRSRELRVALQALGHRKGLDQSTVTSLIGAYDFLRKLENGLQAIRDQQTHDLPDIPVDQARLLIVMGCPTWADLMGVLEEHRDTVSKTFAEIVFRGEVAHVEAQLADRLIRHWNTNAGADKWSTLLSEHDYSEVDDLVTSILHFSGAAVQRQIDVTAEKRLARFMQALLLLLKDKRRPAVVCTRVLAVVSQIVRRSAYVALLNENPGVLKRLVGLCEQSAYLAEEIARFPLLLDELLDPRLYSADITRASMGADLDDRIRQTDPADSERLIEILAQFQRATLFRIAVADVTGNLSIMKVSDRLTELAELVLATALLIAQSDLASRHGLPVVKTEDGEREAGFGVIAYGKLGGMELSYRSDLDLVFLHDSEGSGQYTNGDKPLENSMFFGRLVRRLVHFLTAQTGSGTLYQVDTRLRPSGRSGLLVVNMEGFERYQEENAWTWEHQALLRSRPVAGSAAVAREFDRIRIDTLCNRVHVNALRDDVISMRTKMRRQLDKTTALQFDLKQGEGGIGDIEFLVQYLVLKNAHREPTLIHYTDNIRQLGTLEATGLLDAGDVAELQNIYRAYRLRTHHLALDGKQSRVAFGDFAEERSFVKSVWRREMT
ncbi:MAG: bifunctional [glutamate--ammonia ligase]-adenylyl-L-tyrosine phosphorylase/[glutamate--ammonia-ligase] adenylyltransferase [Woeseiaceae bacterium]